MSAAPSLAFENAPRRVFSRYPINIPVDLIALRSGVPENLPGRCTDLSETGVGAVFAGELAAGQPVSVELRLPNVGVPIRTRAVVRHQSRFHCGLEFVGLSLEQLEMIRYWVYRSTLELEPVGSPPEKVQVTTPEMPPIAAQPVAKTRRKIRIGRRGFWVLIACALALAVLVWWQWQKSWSELEDRAPVRKSSRVAPENRVPFETMGKRIVTKVDPVYPEIARSAGTEGVVVLDAVIAPDGSVKSLRSVSGPESLVQSATEAVRSWKFEPYLSSGQPVEVETTIAVEFRLN